MKEIIEIWIGAFSRGLVVGGLSVFGLAVSNGLCWSGLESGIIAGGGYMFLELSKYYGISGAIVNPKTKYKFILLP